MFEVLSEVTTFFLTPSSNPNPNQRTAPNGFFGLGAWIAYAYVNSWLTVYNNNYCNYVSAQMHELGHNLNLGK